MVAAHLQELEALYSLEAEMSVLGSVLLNNDLMGEVSALLDAKDFYSPVHSDIWKAMEQLARNNKPIDLLTLESELRARNKLASIGGETFLREIADVVPSALNGLHYARLVFDKAVLRRLDTASRETVFDIHKADGSSAQDKVDRAQQRLGEVARRRGGRDFRIVRDLAKDFFVDVDAMLESGKPLHGISTGFSDLDRITTGFYPGELTIVAGRPGMAKTSLALGFSINVAKSSAQPISSLFGDHRDRPGAVAFFSLEMSSIQLVRRMVSMVSGVSAGVCKSPALSPPQYSKLADGCEVLYGLPLYIDDTSGVSPLAMKAKCRRLQADGPLGLVVVDYLQLMSSSRKTENRVQEVSDIARGLKEMSKELNVPVVALSQLNRGVESRVDKRPVLSDLRESGSIEAEADVVMLLYRDSYYRGKEEGRSQPFDPSAWEEAEIHIAKHRNGPVGTVTLGFQPGCARFGLLYDAGGGA